MDDRLDQGKDDYRTSSIVQVRPSYYNFLRQISLILKVWTSCASKPSLIDIMFKLGLYSGLSLHYGLMDTLPLML